MKGFGGIGGFLRYKIENDANANGDGAGMDGFDPDEDFIWTKYWFIYKKKTIIN